jgi:hypothetical protein
MDFRFWKWPNLPAPIIAPIDPNMEFSVSDNGNLKLGWSDLRAPGFGGTPYGNGSLFVENKDIE